MSERIGTDTADVLPGSFGADLILGIGGNDQIDGNAGSDTLAGNAGTDTVFGGLDNDFVMGGQDSDLLYGNEGSDTIFGNKGNDAIEGGSGNDVIFGGQGNDQINGGSGSDVLWGDLGADTFVGGSGSDLFVLTRTSGGKTLEEADTITDFVPGIDRIGLADSVDSKSLNITFQAIANSSTKVNVVVQDLSTGQILAVVKNVSRSEFLNADVFTTVLANSQNVDIEEIPGSATDSLGGGGSGGSSGSGSTPNTVTRASVGKSAPLTTNTTIVTFEDKAYTFSKADFAFFDIDNDAFGQVRILSLPGQGDLFTTSTATDATTGVTTTTKTAIAAGASIPASSLASLTFVPDPDTQGADYASFTFQVSDGANWSNTGTAAIIVKDGSLQPVGDTNVAAPTIDAAAITTAAKEPENGGNITVPLFLDVDLFDDSGKLKSVTVSLSGGSPALGEDVLRATNLPTGILAAAYDATNRSLTLNGEASVDDYETAIKLIQYTNTVNSLAKPDRTVTVAINDGLNPSVSKDYTLSVTADDDLIEIKNADTSDLVAIESTSPSATNPASVSLFADGSDGLLTFVDPDTAGGGLAEIKSIVVSGSNFDSSKDSFVFSATTGIAFTSSGSTLELKPSSGSATVAQYIAALKTIQFQNTSDAPDLSTRQISISVNGEPASDIRKINLQPANDTIQIKNAANSTLTAIENAGASDTNPALVSLFADSPTLTFEDPDTPGSSVPISGIVVSISDISQGTQDSLISNAITPNITINASGKTLTLIGSASASTADYIAALKTIQFKNTSDQPVTDLRQISLAVNNELPLSIRSVGVQKTNDIPTISNGLTFNDVFTISSAPLDLNVNTDLLSGVSPSDGDHDVNSLGVEITGVVNGNGGGSWTFNSNPVTVGTKLASTDTIRFSGATSVNMTTTQPSLTFAAWDGAARSIDTATQTVTVRPTQTLVEVGSAPSDMSTGSNNSYIVRFNTTANLSAKRGLSIFDPTNDTVLFQETNSGGTTFAAWKSGGTSIFKPDIIVHDATTTPPTSNAYDPITNSYSPLTADIKAKADIVFVRGDDTPTNAFLNSGGFQTRVLVVQRKPNNDAFLRYYEAGANATNKTPVSFGTISDTTWNSFIANANYAFSVIP